jgi:hypothetical protein
MVVTPTRAKRIPRGARTLPWFHKKKKELPHGMGYDISDVYMRSMGGINLAYFW